MSLDAGGYLKSSTGDNLGTIKNEYMLRGLKALDYTALNLSHREFYSGSVFLQKMQKKYGLDFISANIVYTETEKPFTEPYVITTVRNGFAGNPIRVGIIGLTEKRNRLLPTRFKEEPQLKAVDPIPVALQEIPKIKKKSDIVILLYCGRMKTLAKIIENSDDIDIVIVAQEYYRVDNFIEERPTVVSSTSQGKYFSTLELKINNKGIQESKKLKQALTERIPDDPKMAKLVADYLEIEKQELENQAH